MKYSTSRMTTRFVIKYVYVTNSSTQNNILASNNVAGGDELTKIFRFYYI